MHSPQSYLGNNLLEAGSNKNEDGHLNGWETSNLL
jgi:hypothetical protein